MLTTSETIDELTLQHQELLQAIVDGDAEKARNGVESHLNFVRDTVRRYDDDEARQLRYSSLPDEMRSPLIMK